jgi:integrase
MFAYDPAQLLDAVPLPASATTRDGFIFDPRDDVWKISSLQTREHNYDFAQVAMVAQPLRHSIKLTLLDVLEKQSPSHANNMWGRFCELYREVLSDGPIVSELNIAHLLNFRSSLTPATVWKLGTVRVLLERAANLGYPLTTQEAANYLKDAVIPGSPKGVDVRTRDPERGAFTTIELEGLNTALNDGYVDGRVNLQEYSLCHVVLAYGARGKQLAMLKECDLIVAAAKDGMKIYTLRIPRAKQRGELARGSFKVRACDRRLGELLERLINHNASAKDNSSNVASGDWPLFIASHEGEMTGFAYHYTAFELNKLIQKTFESVAPIHANAKRFRHTLAKRAHDDGADIYIIAELLDHSDIQNAKVYTEGGPDIVDRLNRTMAMELAPVAQAFAGLLISKSDIEADRTGPSKRIHRGGLANLDRPISGKSA